MIRPVSPVDAVKLISVCSISRAIARASATARAEDVFPGSWHVLAGQEEDTTFVVDIVPLGDHEGEIEPNLRAAAVFIVDTNNRAPISEAGMSEVFGLTGAELAVVSKLLDGLRTEEIAESRNTSISTTRNQIKSALRKTNTRNKAELVRMATKLNPPVSRPNRSD